MTRWKDDLESYKSKADAHLSDNVAVTYARFFQDFFRADAIKTYEWPDIQRIGEHLHCFQSMPLIRKKALGNPNHPIEHYRNSLYYLAHGKDDVVVRIDRFFKDPKYTLRNFGKSAVSEICAYLFADKVFMRNSRDTWAADHYGITPAYPRKSSFAQKLLAFAKAMQPLVRDYEEIVGRRTELPLNLEVDQFFSFIYMEHAGRARQEEAANVWAIGCGMHGEKWPEFRKEGIIAVGFEELGDLRAFPDREAIAAALRAIDGSEGSKRNDTLAAWQFTHELKSGDTIIAKQGFHTIYGVGTIVSDYEYDSSRTNYKNIRKVKWEATGEWVLPEDRGIASKTLTRVTDYVTWVETVRELAGLTRTRPETTSGSSGSSSDTYTIADAVDDLFMSEDRFKEMLAQLELKQNVILQGPPGVGKTFVAKRLAYALMGEKDDERIDMVQFHQSYSYEDFVQGLRPDTKGNFTLRDGVFYRFCKKAEDDDRPFVFIIDEINRGNLSRIFGELMMLMESDKRGPEWSIALTYGGDGERFFIPDNVYIIGTMNTADRSLAMVDYALRRRFAFLSLTPAYDTDDFRDYLDSVGVPDTLIMKITGRIGRINEVIAKDTRGLGPGFCIGHSYFCPRDGDEPTEDWYRRVVTYEIVPLLEEYWFDDIEKVEQARVELLAR